MAVKRVSTKWILELSNLCPGVPVILAGTKTDLRGNDNEDVSYEEGEAKAKEINAGCYIECSSKELFNHIAVFERAASVVLSKPHERAAGSCTLL